MYCINGYPKSQATQMYDFTSETLSPFVGTAPHRYLTWFKHRSLPGADGSGHIEQNPRDVAQPLLREVSAESYLKREAIVSKSIHNQGKGGTSDG